MFPIFRGDVSNFSGGSPLEYGQRSAGTHPTGNAFLFFTGFTELSENLSAKTQLKRTNCALF